MTEEHLFDLALNASDAERAALLDRECAGDAGLRARIEALLQADARSNLTMDSPINRTGSYAARNESAGVVIAGKYKLVEPIGEGGMGSVWLAEQSEPVRRRVALKLIKAGMDSKQVIARFEAERQALAVMDHPNIAKVLDGGVVGSEPDAQAREAVGRLACAAGSVGRPFFVMELVKGVPITKYCDDHKLTPRQRLELFVPVCQAIQHAHQKGIIHRDIKPSNVLIAPYDDKPVPKVIDFGLAKATGVSLTDASMATQFGGVVGTPQYMSPEQASLNNLDIDTRSDVYSLGVLLYELLTGSPPFQQKELEKAGMLEMLRVIREEEPPRPSTKLSTAEALPSLSANRGTEPKKLTGILRNELDWIVMKALEKDRARRYETANGFAADINRYLAGEPVNAHPPSAGYRMKKFLRKHKGPVIAASLVGLALIGGIIGTGWGLVRAEQARERETQRAEGERVAKEEAQAREAETKAVLEFVETKVFAAARPETQEGGLGYDVKLANAITAALPFVEKSFTDQPLIEARLRMTLGKSFFYLGITDVAEQQFRRTRDIFIAKLGPDHPDTLRSMNNLAASYLELGRYAEALALREETLKLFTAKLGRDHPETLVSMGNLASSYAALGRHPDALALREGTVKLQKAKLGPDHPETLRSMYNLADSYEAVGRLPQALALREEMLPLRKAKLGPDHPDTLKSMSSLATSYYTLGRHPEALGLFGETLRLRKAKLGPDHPDTLGSIVNLASSYKALGRLAEATNLYEETLAILKVKIPNHQFTLICINNLAESYVALDRLPEALALYEEALKLQKAKLGANHPLTANTVYSIACLHALMIDKAENRGKQADLAMDWLQQAVAAGFKNVAHMKKDTDLDSLRDREDFKKLIAELEAKAAAEKSGEKKQ